ncbi:hypothetical protein HUR95_10230 [Caldalkalibacillus thermarum TA2.A1]|uniref:Uncharacterized protein n=1 Tax=Caldalkalibacillus thermarum (strain TA2.A1) TaxID=986075 RepID=A0A8X8I861_CALTT|nr:hypothetical protein [Caldalkalibacillus thermarum]QZT32759.1 hypothetical protein HUR95_10230 [Caldalkalibacillus thermarum TA2.A1]
MGKEELPIMPIVTHDINLIYVKTFSSSEEAFNYIRAQLSHLLKSYLELQLPAREIRDIIDRGKRFQSYFRFAISLIENQMTRT